jgi:CHAT domain-containing protein
MNKPNLTIFKKFWRGILRRTGRINRSPERSEGSGGDLQRQPFRKTLRVARTGNRVAIYAAAVIFGLVSTLGLPAWSKHLPLITASSNLVTEEKSALDLAQLGQEYYAEGKLAEAIDYWQQAANNYALQGNSDGRLKSLINQAQAYQDLGLYSQAYQSLMTAFGRQNTQSQTQEIADLINTYTKSKTSLSPAEGIGLRSLGELLRKTGNLEQSKQILELSLAAVDNSEQINATFLSLGNTERAIGNRLRDSWDYETVTEIIETESVTKALQPYQPAITAYQQATVNNSTFGITPLQARLNQFGLLIELERWWQRETERRLRSWVQSEQWGLNQTGEAFLSQLRLKLTQDRQILQPTIEDALNQLPPSRTSVYALINYTECLLKLSQTKQAEAIINRAWKISNQIRDQPTTSYSLGYWGKIAEQQGRNQEAIALTQQALKLAQEQSLTQDVREIIYLWQSQLGRLLKQQGNKAEALLAYASAYNSLQSLRADLNSNLQDIQFDFREEVKPVYLELADLLLQSELSASELDSLRLIDLHRQPTSNSNRLELARRVVESLQLAELDNLFPDICLISTDVAVKIDNLDPQAAFIYPVILPDRLELILSLPGESLRQVTVAVTQQQVNNTIEKLYNNLDNPSIDNSARNIFSTSNQTPQEIQANLETILPLLNDLYKWLIEPIAALLQDHQIKRLIFSGNSSFEQIPLAALYDGRQYLIEKYGIALVPNLQLINPTQIDKQKLRIFAGGVSQSLSVAGEIFPPLPDVPQELEKIQQLFPNTKILLNQNFTTQVLQKQLQDNFAIIHLATHGLFSSQPEQSFILTGDGKPFTIEQLSDLLSKKQINNPELLVLSACETATGDERAILGLAGVAVRSGASSTLATLWSVEDSSTAELMQQFYQNFKNPDEAKLSALQNAQLSLINSLRQNPPLQELQSLPPHPYYWAAYVLVGNWL